MARYRVLPSIAHNFAASFISVMHGGGSDYAMCHLIRAAKATGLTNLRLDVLTGTIDPPELAPESVHPSFAAYCHDFGRHVTSGGAALDMVSEAVLALTISPVEGFGLAAGTVNGRVQAEMRIRDDRGKDHVGNAVEDYPCSRWSA